MQLAQDPHKDTPLNYGGTTFVVLHNPKALPEGIAQFIIEYASPSMVEDDFQTGQYDISHIKYMIDNQTIELEGKDDMAKELKKFVEYCGLQNISYVQI